MSFKLLNQKSAKKDQPTENIKVEFGSKYETGLLSICLQNPLKLAELRSKITDNYFLFEHNRVAFVAMSTLQDNPKVKTIDSALLIQAAKDLGIYETGIGEQYFVTLTNAVYDESNFDFYLDQVSEAYNKYRLSSLADNLKGKTFEARRNLDTDLSVKDITSNFIAELSSLEAGNEDGIITLSDVCDEYYDQLEDKGLSIPGLRTGFNLLDSYMNGFTNGSLTIFAAMAKQGKSSLLLNLALSIIDNYDIDVLYLSTEMPTKDDSYRLLAMVSDVNLSEILHGTAFEDPVKAQKITSARKIIKEKYAPRLHMQYVPFFKGDVIFNKIRLAKYKFKVGLAIFDYIKMDQVTKEESGAREDQILGDLTNYLKMAAGNCNIPVLSACQINTRNNNIADSDRLIRYCDTLIRIDKMNLPDIDQSSIPMLKKYGTTWLNIIANRSGRCGKVPVTHYKPRLKFVPALLKEEKEDSVDADYILNNLVPEMEGTPNTLESVSEADIANDNPYGLSITPLVAGQDPFNTDDEDPLF